MLLEFTVGNFHSFKEKKTLSMEATSITEHAESNVMKTERYDLLKGAVIYGANAGGKSNLIKAMSTMRRIVLHYFESSSTKKLDITPFLLSTETEKSPSFFEVLFIIKNIRYRYGFEIDNTSIKSEWLFEALRKTEKPLFIRENDAIEVMRAFPEGENLEEKTRDNALFLSVVDQFNGKTAKRIIQWFNNFVTISGLSHEGYKGITFSMLESKKLKLSMLRFYTELDLGFDDIIIKNNEQGENLPEITTVYKDQFGKTILELPLKQESEGIKKIVNLSGAIVKSLNEGGALIIDDLDTNMHTLIVQNIVKKYFSKNQNPKNTQLIFSTHDTNLLSMGNYRRDQIYFVEKNNYKASDLYSLVEYKKDGGKAIRKDRSFEKDYLQGRYGAVPFFGKLSNISK